MEKHEKNIFLWWIRKRNRSHLLCNHIRKKRLIVHLSEFDLLLVYWFWVSDIFLVIGLLWLVKFERNFDWNEILEFRQSLKSADYYALLGVLHLLMSISRSPHFTVRNCFKTLSIRSQNLDFWCLWGLLSSGKANKLNFLPLSLKRDLPTNPEATKA